MLQHDKYNTSDSYCVSAAGCQSVPSREEYGLQHPSVAPKDYDTNRAQTLYSCSDDYQMGTIQDNQIYIATTDGQHDQIAKGEHVDAQGGLSGYFSDQATIDACKDKNGVLDNTAYNESVQIAPYRENGLAGMGDASYKPHVDCFELDRDALYKNYGTYDFNAAVGKCDANNQFGPGGGNQGYNPCISEMIDNGTLKHRPDKSYSDKTISKSEHNNSNDLKNSIVQEADYNDMMRDAKVRAQDCVNNNTPHPSSEACANGYPREHAVQIDSSTGHSTPTPSNRDLDLSSDLGMGSAPIKNTPLDNGIHNPTGIQ